MTDQEIRNGIEAMLFATGRALELQDMAGALGVDEGKAREIIEKMAEELKGDDSALEIIRLETAYQLCTKPLYNEALIALLSRPKKPRLTDIQLEVLSVIAYRQPVTKAEVERIRGVNSDHAVNKLIEYGLVNELGRSKLPGRPVLFGTTREFMRLMGISSREELPDISPVTLADFREEADTEARELKVDV